MVPTISADRLRSCCTAGATSTVGGGKGGGGFLQPGPSSRPTHPPRRTHPPTRPTNMAPPTASAEGRVIDNLACCRAGPSVLPARSPSGRGRRGGHVHDRRRVVGRGEGDLDPSVLA